MTTNDLLTDQMAEMKAELAELRAEVRHLRSGGARPTPTVGPSVDASDEMASRRQLLRRGGLAIGAGLAAAAVVGRPAAAANGDDVLQGSQTIGTTLTKVENTTAGDLALHGHSSATTGDGWGVLGLSSASAGVGVVGIAPHVGVAGAVGGAIVPALPGGVVGTDISDSGTGVRGDVTGANASGVYGTSSGQFGVAVKGEATTGIGVQGTSAAGVGGYFYGTTAALLFGSSGADPTTLLDPHDTGEMYFDDNGDLWVCTEGGFSGTWRKLTGPAVTSVTPFRVYDSRFTDGALSTSNNRVISVADSIDVDTGAVVATDAVPAGATAVFFNLTVTQSSAEGYLSVTPGDAGAIGASTANWTTTGTTVANGSLVNLDGQRQVKVFAGGVPTASTHFIIDITGFMA